MPLNPVLINKIPLPEYQVLYALRVKPAVKEISNGLRKAVQDVRKKLRSAETDRLAIKQARHGNHGGWAENMSKHRARRKVR